MAAVLLATRRLVPQATPRGGADRTGAAPDRWDFFRRLAAVAVCRAFVFYGLNTFIPLYWIHVFGKSKAAGGAALTLMLSAGVAATLAGGWLADRVGRRRVVIWSHALLFPFLFAFLSAGSATVALALLVPIGVTLYAPFSVMTVMGQEYVPSRVATASGFIIGVAVTLGGLVAPVLGRIADLRGVHAALSTLLLVPLIGALLAMTLPRDATGLSSGSKAKS
jgi:FSR family fosmidomycin resistance protein-like MFS transporter